MHLKRLELSGFKSFAKTTVLEFPSRIVAVVGPNGSGKSNIAEAIRWVLGEQSIKMLRGKKGEDLIWSGSPPPSAAGGGGTSRMGKASVGLVFDNRDHAISLDFDEVVLSRKIFRDGSNEYAMNGSVVRLKDVVELCARMGLGESKHNLIGQGEVDRVLLATPRARREMMDSALGLRVYQLKKNEAERKLDVTAENIRQVEGLVRELAPHLKFLRLQAKRAEAREGLVMELRTVQDVYFMREDGEIAAAAAIAAVSAAPFIAARDAIEKQIADIEKEIAVAEKKTQEKKSGDGKTERLTALQDQRRICERELGRLEGMRDAAGEASPMPRTVSAPDVRHISDELRQFLSEVRSLAEEESDADILRGHLLALVEDMERTLDIMERGASFTQEPRHADVRLETETAEKFGKEILVFQEKLAVCDKEIIKLEDTQRAERADARSAYEAIRERENILRKLRDGEREAALALERLRFDEERLTERRMAFVRDRKEFGLDDTPQADSSYTYRDITQAELRRKIERLRLKLEEIGGIDETIKKEYEETELRSVFLEKELEDLKNAHASLKTLIKELDARVKNDFKEGFTKIKQEFHDYFKVIFGGGSAKLSITKQESRIKEEDGGELNEEDDEEDGIEIEVDLPRKRIKGLAMLSGGERALTAVALLFAIAAVNPPPFIVLDETDAALDEANSRRYASILKELAKKTQLVVITHNRETMQCAGVLYGVTMGDDGVSRLLSLKMEDADEFASG
ncbi:MAG: AAA family ATPase [Candidatus Sungiibacteriota bacterium]